MKALIQRVKSASVKVKDDVISNIGYGMLIFLGIADGDSEDDCRYLASKIENLRIFDDKVGKMNLSCRDINGDILVVSQFTLLGDAKKGNRPSYSKAAPPDKALPLYHYFTSLIKESGLVIKTGKFAEHMDITLVNDGPVTIMIDSRNKPT